MGTSDTPGFLDRQHAAYAFELNECATIHAEYLQQLRNAGFSEDQAFTLVRDHHWLFQWGALAPDQDAAPSWPVAASSEPRPSTGSVSPLLRPTTSEQ